MEGDSTDAAINVGDADATMRNRGVTDGTAWREDVRRCKDVIL